MRKEAEGRRALARGDDAHPRGAPERQETSQRPARSQREADKRHLDPEN